LHTAAFNGSTNAAKVLIANGADDVFARSFTEQTPLHLAAKCGHFDVFRVILDILFITG
jgi:ankyrin repeat protein